MIKTGSGVVSEGTDMAYVDWEIEGSEISSCNCDWGCPCQFNALPTHGNCQAAVVFHIEKGHFGDTNLNGLHFAGVFRWPGAVHEGDGEVLPIVDERASEEQRNAILQIMSGLETEPGSTIFNVFAATYSKVHEPVFTSIDYNGDAATRRGKFGAAGFIKAMIEPITNPVTGEEHIARVSLPHGFEYLQADYASSTVETAGPIELSWQKSHAHFARIHMGTNGVMS
jgi:hypothetical protein